MQNVNKVKFLSERICGAPPVIFVHVMIASQFNMMILMSRPWRLVLILKQLLRMGEDDDDSILVLDDDDNCDAGDGDGVDDNYKTS